MTEDEDYEGDAVTFEERADQVEESVLIDGTVTEDHFDRVHKALLAKGLVLIQGPRGCGKTHLMRYTALRCRQNPGLPLAIYVSFNRYLRLEPLLRTRADAVIRFQSWVLGSILVEAERLAEQLGGEAFDVSEHLAVWSGGLTRLVDRLERRLELDEDDEEIATTLTIEATASTILAMCEHYDRARAIVLLDDAALTLTPEYMVELFDVVRVLKHPRISPKASVYPGTTEYGPRFHPNHEGKTISAWLPIEDPGYVHTMREIATKRYPRVDEVPEEVERLLIYASFGIPRAYLTMVRSFVERTSETPQQAVMTIIREHQRLRLAEFRSLSLKVARLETLVATGEILLARAIEVIRTANEEDVGEGEKQLVVGLETGGLTPIVNRMLNLLIEAGLFFEEKAPVSHGGTDRTYRRFTPHLAALIAARAFSGRSRGNSAKALVETLEKPSAKHPARRKIDTILDPAVVKALRFNLPPCDTCKTRRMTESQLFCHNCGSPLVLPSTFEACMGTEVEVIASLTRWEGKALVQAGIATVGDFMAIQDPGTTLRKIWQVGRKRSARMAEAINAFVYEYAS